MGIGIYTIIGIALDLFDWVVIGSIPVVGDVVDALATLFWLTRLGFLGLIAGIELIPVVDVLPTNIALGYLADQKGKQKLVKA